MTEFKQNVSTFIVLFGATGDLASRNIIPAIYRLFRRNILGRRFVLLGTSITEGTNEYLHDIVRQSLIGEKQDYIDNFLNHIYYETADVTKQDDFEHLKGQITKLRSHYGEPELTIYHMSVSPALFTDLARHLNQSGITNMKGQHRLIIEKPFGNDLASSEQLNQELNEYYDEKQIFRIDHYLGMEMVQNILGVRFYNSFIRKLWDRHSISNVQISLKEDQSIGQRGSYYDVYGAFLDMFQNHLLQLMAITGMDLPEEPTSETFHSAKVDFFKAIPDLTEEEVDNYTVRGQYKSDDAGVFNNYRDEEDVDPNSNTESYIAGRIMIDNDRWQGVPFYYRTGKALDETLATITLVLKTDFDISEGENLITFYIRPNDGTKITLNQKVLGPAFKPQTVKLESYRDPTEYEATEYEKLIYDVIEGNHMFFTTWEEVREQWRITDSIRRAWEDLPEPDMPNYTAGTEGPKAANNMLEQDGNFWID